MKKSPRLVIPFFIFGSTLFLAEGFFQLNAHFRWLVPIPVHLSPVTTVKPKKIPSEIIKEVTNKFPNLFVSEKDFEIIDPYKSQRKKYLKYLSANDLDDAFFYEPNDNLPKSFHSKVSIANYEIIDAVYNFDENHFRLSGEKTQDKSKKNFVLLGCSFSFGLGVNDSETITGFLSQDNRYNHEFNFYNLGVNGGTITNILRDIYIKDRINGLNRNGGIVVYNYWLDHFGRHFSTLDTIRRKYPTLNDLQFSLNEGQLEAEKKYSGLNLIKYGIFKLLSKSELLFYTGWGYNTISLEHQKEFVRFLSFIKDFYKSQYNLDFHLFIMSEYDIPSDEFVSLLNSNNIPFIVYDHIHKYFPRNQVIIPGDGHFNPKGNYYFSRLMADAFLTNSTQGPVKNSLNKTAN